MAKNNQQNNLGFTLIELLIVISLIGILVAGLIMVINPLTQLRKGRDSRRKQDIEQIRRGLEIWKNDQTSPIYPATLPWGAALGNAMNSVPCDLTSGCGGTYGYSYTIGVTDDLTYTLIACLENSFDTDKDATNNTAVCGTERYSYTRIQP